MFHLVGMLSSRGLSVGLAATVLGLMGVGKVGRLLIPTVTRRSGLAAANAAWVVVELVGLVLPLVATSLVVLAPTAVLVGAASGMTTILRPLLMVEVVGVEPFVLTNARIQRATTVARSGAPFALGAAFTAFGWPAAWAAALLVLGAAFQRYLSLR